MSIELLNKAKVRTVYAGQTVLSLLFGSTSRTAEYRFVLKNLPLVGSTVLDVGCCDSLLALGLAKKGYKVYGIDTRQYQEKHPNLTFVQEDIVRTSFPDGLFDAVIAVSTIEHIGLGLYADPIHDNADIMTVREIYRILRPDGRFIVTIPFAGEYKLAKYRGGYERYYDADTIRKLFEGFQIKAREFLVGVSRFNWVNASEKEASDPSLRYHANIALLLVKQQSQ
jgi:SAM-dependent methyltransferase